MPFFWFPKYQRQTHRSRCISIYHYIYAYIYIYIYIMIINDIKLHLSIYIYYRYFIIDYRFHPGWPRWTTAPQVAGWWDRRAPQAPRCSPVPRQTPPEGTTWRRRVAVYVMRSGVYTLHSFAYIYTDNVYNIYILHIYIYINIYIYTDNVD